MGENSKIEWTHHTFNPWIGCTKVSPGCQHCYAEALATRFGIAEWGPSAQRVRTSATNWQKPLAWNRKAEQKGQRAHVFCASLADVFEDKAEPDAWRLDLFGLIEQTPSLDWLLLTKRPENVAPLIERHHPQGINSFFDHNPNVWIGTSVENQEQAKRRIPYLVKIPTPVRFLSCEPLLGKLNLRKWTEPDINRPPHGILTGESQIDWIIAGGESGPHARPLDPEWVLNLRDHCTIANIPFFFKQWGEWEYRPTMRKVGKKAAGRTLNGRTWSELPTPQRP